jgi:hypothetical protein
MITPAQEQKFLSLIEEHKKIIYKVCTPIAGRRKIGMTLPRRSPSNSGSPSRDTAYALLGASYLVWNVIVGVAVIALAIWVSRKLATRIERSSIVQGLMNTLAGYNLNAATQSLRNLKDFEREERDDI